MNHEYLTVHDVSQLLKVNAQTVRRWIWSGKLPYIKVGQTIRVPKSELDNMLIHRQKRVQGATQSSVELQALAESVLAQLDAACEQISAHLGEVEDSVDVLASVRERSVSNE